MSSTMGCYAEVGYGSAIEYPWEDRSGDVYGECCHHRQLWQNTRLRVAPGGIVHGARLGAGYRGVAGGSHHLGCAAPSTCMFPRNPTVGHANEWVEGETSCEGLAVLPRASSDCGGREETPMYGGASPLCVDEDAESLRQPSLGPRVSECLSSDLVHSVRGGYGSIGSAEEASMFPHTRDNGDGSQVAASSA